MNNAKYQQALKAAAQQMNEDASLKTCALVWDIPEKAAEFIAKWAFINGYNQGLEDKEPF